MSRVSPAGADNVIDRVSGCNSVGGVAVASRDRGAGGMPPRRRLPGVRWIEDLPPFVSSPAVTGDGAGAGNSDRVTGGGALAVGPGMSSVTLSDGTRLSFIAMSHLMPELTDAD